MAVFLFMSQCPDKYLHTATRAAFNSSNRKSTDWRKEVKTFLVLTLHSVRVSFGSFSTGHRHNEASSVRRFETVAAAFLSRRALEHSAHSGHSPHTWPFLLTKHGLPRNKDIRLTSSFFYPVNWTLFHLSQSPPSSFIRNIPLFVCAATRLNYSCPTPPSGWWMNQKISTKICIFWVNCFHFQTDWNEERE